MAGSNVCEENILKKQWPFSSFFHKAASVPLVADAISYIGAKYNYVKSSNVLVGDFINGIESSVTLVTSTTFGVTKNILPYDYADQLACKGLDGVERFIPEIKKPTSQIWKDGSTYVLSTISGVEDETKLPNSVWGAISTRISSMVSHTSKKASESSYANSFRSLAHKTLNKLEGFLDYLLPKKRSPEKKSKAREIEEEVIKRTTAWIADLKLRIIDLAKHAAELKGEVVAETQNLNVKHVFYVIEHWLSNVYKKLQTPSENESKIAKAFRVCALVFVGLSLSVMGAIAATVPKARDLAVSMILKAKAALYATYKLSQHITRTLCTSSKKWLNGFIEYCKRIEESSREESNKFILFVRKASQMLMDFLSRIESSLLKSLNEVRIRPLAEVHEENATEMKTTEKEVNKTGHAQQFEIADTTVGSAH